MERLPAEPVALSQQKSESVLQQVAISLTRAQRDELERRWQAFQQNPDEGESWEDVKRSLLTTPTSP